ncbi:glucans biosynthesis glucosyltransferase MdoH [Acuticoccus mangrovi]|uniref:Glucans biosynthesis glucosyltransferase H n=1 Tax=Acuticoccus mangrovi TaxID=2796142 RepID=A0A934IN88_9HYPH|nr:glucans biosynthesis glucosyltransferase MdoH [Acuticoccus mangrovi]MBJ3775715.1 glucans biosynthesis glucosyltransferase MdoH [Acuticoccus mangrovi]
MDQLSYTPPSSPLSMPEQSLDIAPPKNSSARRRRARGPSLATIAARTILLLVTLAGTIFAVTEMHAVASVGGMAALEWVLVGVFAVAFAWIAFSAGNAIVGLLFPINARSGDAPKGPPGRTAIIMPVYNEDPRDTFSALAAMIEDLPDAERSNFEVFILSDTTNAETWIAEERALATLRELAGATCVWYRRRRENVHRKAGNVADFVRRWGGRYDHMVVLDADSLMTGECLVGLRDAMVADPDAGIIQTTPVLIGATTPFARAQQFANTITGPVVAEGVAAWQGEDGNYWGHNAIIRMVAFAEAAGLPQLPGKPPFGGTILSHDFVEAALIRRAGWSVTMRPDIIGSYEGAPTDLFGLIKRDRRWAQGNLQHARILPAAGIKTVNRAHLLIGILSYLMSPVWLFLILVGIALAVQATVIRPEYFPKNFALFPTWPAFDTERMINLFLISLAVLLLPKAVGFVRALLVRSVRKGSGGVVGVTEGTVVELVISTLIAPIMMLAQTGIVTSILLGRAVGWMPQARRGGVIPWRSAAQFHMLHVLVGIGLGVVALMHSPALALWMSPTLLALVFAVPISKFVGSEWLGRKLRKGYVMLTPQESRPPTILRTARRLAARFPAEPPRDALLALADDPHLLRSHIQGLTPASGRPRGEFDTNSALATVKLGEASTLEEFTGWLCPSERLCVVSDACLLEKALSLREDAKVKAAKAA